jgi:hypothetical protein
MKIDRIIYDTKLTVVCFHWPCDIAGQAYTGTPQPRVPVPVYIPVVALSRSTIIRVISDTNSRAAFTSSRAEYLFTICQAGHTVLLLDNGSGFRSDDQTLAPSLHPGSLCVLAYYCVVACSSLYSQARAETISTDRATILNQDIRS